MNRISLFAMLVLVVLMSPTIGAYAAVHGDIELEPPEEETAFGYADYMGPGFWPELDHEWELCGDGEEQSPIDVWVLDAVMQDVPDLVFDYHESTVAIANNGHTVKWNYEPGSSITLGGVRYDLLQFHFHTPSEHALQGGARFPLEVHLVHMSASGDLAVVGVMIGARSDYNNAFPYPRQFRQMVPTAEGVVVEFHHKTIDASRLLPADKNSYRYNGSLTTPPCTEGVQWILMANPIELSKNQVNVLLDALNSLKYASEKGTNNRPTQPLHGRQVFLGE
ncbi:MAG: carbonic anhydrase family protein [bacterium]|nr:carbonic anhydrase family protein [bacterium]